jgi:hypothetical protein
MRHFKDTLEPEVDGRLPGGGLLPEGSLPRDPCFFGGIASRVMGLGLVTHNAVNISMRICDTHHTIISDRSDRSDFLDVRLIRFL